MKSKQTTTETLAAALDVLARDIQSDDGVANAAIAEAAQRLREQQSEIKHDQQLSMFSNDLDGLVNRYAAEFDLNMAAVCGVLMMKIRLIQDAALERES